MWRLLILLTLFVLTGNGWAQERTRKIRNKERLSYIFRVTLRDKQESPYSLDRPTRFLSKRSIERRKRQ